MTEDKNAIIDSVYKKRLQEVEVQANYTINALDTNLPRISEAVEMLNLEGLGKDDRVIANRQISEALTDLSNQKDSLKNSLPKHQT